MGFTNSMRDYTGDLNHDYQIIAFKVNNDIIGPAKIFITDNNNSRKEIYQGDYKNGICGNGVLKTSMEYFDGMWVNLISNRLCIFDGTITISCNPDRFTFNYKYIVKNYNILINNLTNYKNKLVIKKIPTITKPNVSI